MKNSYRNLVEYQDGTKVTSEVNTKVVVKETRYGGQLEDIAASPPGKRDSVGSLTNS